jgi:eukaryotic-like serine/threonine-protein kinase
MELELDDTPPLSVADDRYELVRKLGEGGSGVVYLVRDRETGEELAYKRLQRADEHSIARLKREFRTLSTINHKNVIRLYDLGRTRDEWFLTMEYLDGHTLLDHLDSNSKISGTLRRTESGAGVGVDDGDLARILSVFHQLATGIHALHQRGVLHRDLKPSNVIVEKGRVVVLDFGLALEFGDAAATITMDGAIAGTPAYMAPEQLQGRDWGEPNDWYAFGVMLFEALSGYLPIEGRLQELLRRKIEQDAVPIERHVAGLPRALSTLCNALLKRQPELRPAGAEVLAVLETLSASSGNAAQLSAANDPQANVPRVGDAVATLFGREAERAALRKAYSVVEQGAAAVVHVRGVSGAGKSALLERFLDEIEQEETQRRNSALMLRGRCYERETVAFKALDAVLDALVTQLSREDDVEVSHTLPREVQALAQLFPVLTRLSAVQRLLRPATPTLARPHTREAAESALRDMFTRIASRRTVVIWIDDLHWGDADSARILRSWLHASPIAGLLLVLSYRSDETATSPCLRVLLADGERDPSAAAEHVIQLGGLHEQHIRALCEQRFAGTELSPEMRGEIVDHIVSEADGSPFLASQLAVLALSELSDKPIDAPEVLTIESLVERRTALLSRHAKQLLCVLAVAGRPLPMRMALKLSAAANNARAIVHELSGLGLIRSQTSDGERQLAVYHDRLREAVLVSLSAAARTGMEKQLLAALEAEDSDPAWLHALAFAAGEQAAALRYGLVAAEQAFNALAFERAAQLYQVCVELSDSASAESLELWQKLANALAHAGRGRQAAAAYHEAAQRASGMLRLALERKSASHLLRTGAFTEGEALIQKVLAELDLSTPTSTVGLIAAIGWERGRLALRKVDGEAAARRPANADAQLRFEGELCGTLSIELQPYDPLRGALFQARSLRLALDYGTPELIARALCVAATMAAVSGGDKGFVRAQALLGKASKLEQAKPSPLVFGNIASARAVCAMLQGDMPGVVEHAGEAERMFREASGVDEGEYYHRYTVLTVRIGALFELGQPELAIAELQHAVNEARATQNVAALLLLSASQTRAEIMQDQAARGKPRLEAEHAQLPPQRFGLLHVYYLASVMRIGCSTGDHAWALHWMHDEFERLEHSVLKRGGPFATIAPALHARLLLNRAVALGHSGEEAEHAVARDLRAMERNRRAAAPGVVARTRARLALIAGDRDTPRALFELSSRCFEQDKVIDEAARDRFALGAVLGGEEGAQMQAMALLALRAHGYVDPRKDLLAYYPELFLDTSA